MNAMHFDGLSGAAYVSLVAFSIVFIVLLGLTLVIFAMRFFAAGERPKPDDGATAPQRPQSAPAASTAPAVRAEGAQARVVAAITAAILAATGGMGRVVSIAPETVDAVQKGARWTRAWRASGVLNLISRSVDRGWKR